MDNCNKAVIEALGNYLKGEIPELSQVLYDFPAANVTLKYPAISIFSGEPKFTNEMPYILKQAEASNHKASVKYVVGMYDWKLQLDLWCRNKEERFSIIDKMFDAINKQVEPMGLSLKLGNYHDTFCRYDMTGYVISDGEAASQRNEWRAMWTLLGNCKAVREKSQYLMETIENNLTIPDTI